MESDSDSDASIDNEDVPVGIVLRRRPAGGPGEAAHANLGKKTRQSTQKVLPTRACTRAGAADARATRAALPSTRKAIATHLQHLHPRLRGAHFDEQLSLRVVHFALKEKDQYLETKGKKAKVKGGAQVRDTVCAKLGIGSATYSAIMQSAWIITRRSQGLHMKVVTEETSQTRQLVFHRRVKCKDAFATS